MVDAGSEFTSLARRRTYHIDFVQNTAMHRVLDADLLRLRHVHPGIPCCAVVSYTYCCCIDWCVGRCETTTTTTTNATIKLMKKKQYLVLPYNTPHENTPPRTNVDAEFSTRCRGPYGNPRYIAKNTRFAGVPHLLWRNDTHNRGITLFGLNIAD